MQPPPHRLEPPHRDMLGSGTITNTLGPAERTGTIRAEPPARAGKDMR